MTTVGARLDLRIDITDSRRRLDRTKPQTDRTGALVQGTRMDGPSEGQHLGVRRVKS